MFTAGKGTHYCVHCGFDMKAREDRMCPVTDGDVCEPKKRNPKVRMTSKKKKTVKMAELRTDILEADFAALSEARFMPVIRWVKFGTSRLLRTHEALRKVRSVLQSGEDKS